MKEISISEEIIFLLFDWLLEDQESFIFSKRFWNSCNGDKKKLFLLLKENNILTQKRIFSQIFCHKDSLIVSPDTVFEFLNCLDDFDLNQAIFFKAAHNYNLDFIIKLYETFWIEAKTINSLILKIKSEGFYNYINIIEFLNDKTDLVSDLYNEMKSKEFLEDETDLDTDEFLYEIG